MNRFKDIFILFLSLLSLISSTAHGSQVEGKYFNRTIFVIFENTNYSAAMQQPFFKQLASAGASFSNFLALTHPSQGNYIALTSGDLNGVFNDANHDVDADNVIDLLEAKGIAWKVYAEDYPGNCFTGSAHGYVRKHNPFISYVNIQQNPARCANIVNASQFDLDSANGSLPQFIFYIPNIKNDGHDTGVAYADSWYSRRFGPFLSNASFMDKTIVISTFDESGASPVNQIYTSIYGPMVRPGTYDTPLTIPSLLKLTEDNWNLGDLGKLDRTATPIPDIWK